MDLHLLVSSLIILLVTLSIRQRIVKFDRPLGNIFFLAFIVRFIFALFQDTYQIIPYVWDERAFLLAGQSFKDYLNMGNFPFPFKEINSITSYGTFLGLISKVFGDYSLIYRIINGFIGSLLVVLVYRISKMILINKISSYIIAFLVALTPSYILFTSLIMRDSIVWILTLFIFYFFIKGIKNMKIYYVLMGSFVSTILIFFRKLNAPILVLLGFLALIFILVQRKYYFKKIKLKFMKVSLLGIIASLGVFTSIFTLFFILSTYGRSDIIDYASSELLWRNQGGGAYLEYIHYKNFYDIVYYFPVKFLHFFFGPFLWNSNSLFSMLVSIESFLNTIFFILILTNIKYFFKMDFKRKLLFMFTFFFTFSFIAANSVIDANYGTAIRHKMIFMPTFYMFGLFLVENSKLFNFIKIKI